MNALVAAAIVVSLAAQAGVETIARDSMSNVDAPRQAVAKTQKEWDTLWRQHAGDKPAPKIDFTRRMVVAVFLGSRATGGFRVDITGARRDGDKLIVEWREQRPDRRDIVAQVLTSPAHLATVETFDGEVVFQKADQ